MTYQQFMTASTTGTKRHHQFAVSLAKRHYRNGRTIESLSREQGLSHEQIRERIALGQHLIEFKGIQL